MSSAWRRPSDSMKEPMLVPPRDGADIGDYSLRDFAAKWMVQQCDLAELGVYRGANAHVIASADPRPRIVFVGDSITQFWVDLAHLENQDTAILNRGIRGQNSTQMLLRFEDDAIALRPALIVLLCGTNDLRSYVGSGASLGLDAPERVMRNVTAMADISLARNVPIVLGSVPSVNPKFPVYRDPNIILSLNRQLADFASERLLEFADYHRTLVDSAGFLDEAFSADGVHPTPAGYARMQIELRRCLRNLGFNLSCNETASP